MMDNVIAYIYDRNASSNTNNIANDNNILSIWLPIIEINVHDK